MQTDLLAPVFWLGLALLGSTAWNLSLRRLMKGEHDHEAAGTVSNALTIVWTLPFILLLGLGFGSPIEAIGSLGSAPAWLAAAAAALFSVGFTCLSFKASKVVEASERSIVGRLNLFWALLFSALFLGESVGLQKERLRVGRICKNEVIHHFAHPAIVTRFEAFASFG